MYCRVSEKMYEYYSLGESLTCRKKYSQGTCLSCQSWKYSHNLSYFFISNGSKTDDTSQKTGEYSNCSNCPSNKQLLNSSHANFSRKYTSDSSKTQRSSGTRFATRSPKKTRLSSSRSSWTYNDYVLNTS